MIDQANPYTLHTLPNGLQVVIERMPTVRSAAAGFLVKTGARDETADVAGISHFLEHMMFKGTRKRSWRQITVDFDRMGSSYNAYTSEDRTMYYGWVRRADIVAQIELLADMLRSTLPEDEFEMERNVILEEIAMAKDSLEHVMFDFLQEKVFAGHPLAWPILGYADTVGAMTREQMLHYFERRYAPGNVMLFVAGDVDPDTVLDATAKFCGDWSPVEDGHHRAAPAIKSGTDSLQLDRFQQQIVAMTFPAVSATDPRAEIGTAAATILGGENSRFFWNIVQKGLAHRAGAYHMDYADCGTMILYAVCQPDDTEQVIEAMRTEAAGICRGTVEEKEVARVRNRRRTSLAIEGEVPYHRLTQLMDDMEFRGAPRPVDKALHDLEAITPESIKAYYESYPVNGEGHLTVVGPRAWPT